MGDIAEDFRNWGWDPENDDEIFNEVHCLDIWNEYKNKKLYWRTKDDKDILIQDMTTSHIQNVLKKVKKFKDINLAASEWIDVFEFELKEREKIVIRSDQKRVI